jgi:ribose transport system ATP-binding protein
LYLHSPHDAVKAGIGMVPEDRKQQGIILSLSVKQNISLSDLDKITGPFGFIQEKKERNNVLELIRKLSIKARNENVEAATLSGGNQQKLALAKWINRKCMVLIIDEPTRGVDIGAKVEIYHLINELSHQGVAILVISSESSELMGICDRILVMRKGKIVGELDRKNFCEEEILRISIGA